mmetsp:Transcript_24720/g.57579  ORF Transcript_24720/g.57579 Transcript_24720/m.57579 type:complete len:116 (-) Transcript_24720:295-642(-)
MKLLTHNMLTSPGVHNGFPLAIEVESMEVVEADFNADFIVRMVEKLEYDALVTTVAGLGMEGKLPGSVPDGFAENEEFLRALHHVLLEVDIVEGQLVCPETGKKFPIKEGIPSML